MALPPDMLDAILAHVLAARPNEACGLIAGDAPAEAGGRPTRWIPTRNALASPYRFDVHPDDLLRAHLALDDAGEVVWAIVHSHVASPAVPSPSDLRGSSEPKALQLVVSLAGAEPEVRAWQVRDGVASELTLAAVGRRGLPD